MMRCLMNFALLAAVFAAVVKAEVAETGWFSEESRPSAVCPSRDNSQSIIMGLFCSGKYCDNLKLQCIYREGYTRGTEVWTPYFSEEQGRQFCPGSHVMIGMRCRGSYCDDISLLCLRVSRSLYPNDRYCDDTAWFSEEHGGHKVIPTHSYPVGLRCRGSYCDDKKLTYCYESGYGPNTWWFSEENNGKGLCPEQDSAQTMLMGLSCSGAYCDNLKVHCASTGAVHVANWGYWTEWISEELKMKDSVDEDVGLLLCNALHVVTGVKCRGAYCDDVSLRCSLVLGLPTLSANHCGETGWFSEENEGYAEIPDNAYPVGIRCRGAYCDDKQIHYCFSAK